MLMLRRTQTWVFIVVACLLTLGSLPVAPTSAQTLPPIYVPQTGHYLRGAFRSLWEARGGVEIFGYPITEEYIRKSDGKLVQFFERSRFELRVNGNQAAIDFGLIGREYIQQRGLGFPTIAPFVSTSTRRYFPETGHSLQGKFKTFWDSRGDLALFGYPLSEEVRELLPDGVERTVQYFERARFELNGTHVSLGLLGTYLAPCQRRPALPPNAPPSGPLPEGDPAECAAPPPQSMLPARVYPDPSAPGTTLGFDVRGYVGGETVSLWLNLPNGTTRALPYRAIATSDGAVLIGFRTEATDPEGRWSIVGQGLTSGRVAMATFTLKR